VFALLFVGGIVTRIGQVHEPGVFKTRVRVRVRVRVRFKIFLFKNILK
jgi:hypothetical protein